jgi:glycosyltransferase involved in cell wall biosynthesis
MKAGFVIPVYRHGETARALALRLAGLYGGMPVILVDDGNEEADRAPLEEAAQKAGVYLVVNAKNCGKGGAVMRGLEKAAELGLSHVLQIDGDGQHDEGRISFFLEQAELCPDKVICGFPEFDASAPKGRVIGRKISNFWAAVVTLSRDLKDVLCGFRVYPVGQTLAAGKSPFLDKRMGFDAEIIVRLYWAKTYPVFYPVKVNYPEGGRSNFRMFRDNVRISWVFTRLFFGMLFRLPGLLRNEN